MRARIALAMAMLALDGMVLADEPRTKGRALPSTWAGGGLLGGARPGTLAAGGSLEAGINVQGVLFRVSGEAALGNPALVYGSAMIGYALDLGEIAPYIGGGLGLISYNHSEFLEPQFSYRVNGTAISPEVGVMLQSAGWRCRVAFGVQAIVPISLKLAYETSTASPVSYSPWFLVSARLLF